MRPVLRASLLVVALLLAGCDLSMTDQARYDTEAPAGVFRNGSEAQPLPDGVVAQNDPAIDAEIAKPPFVTPALVARGHERFDIYCAPCHGLAGYGNGLAVERGFPQPPSFHDARLRAAPAQHFFDVITQGYGIMYSYAGRVSPHDRWAIIAYIRALQLSQHAGPDVANAEKPR